MLRKAPTFFNIVLFMSGLVIAAGPARADFIDDFRIKSGRDYERVRIKRVISADTIELDTEERFKLIGLKAPETPKNREQKQRDEFGFIIKETDPTLTIEERAFLFAKTLLEEQWVRLEFDRQKSNEQHEDLAYVFLADSGLFANAEIIKAGFAHLSIRPPNTKYADQLREAYKTAKKELKGLQSH